MASKITLKGSYQLFYFPAQVVQNVSADSVVEEMGKFDASLYIYSIYSLIWGYTEKVSYITQII